MVVENVALIPQFYFAELLVHVIVAALRLWCPRVSPQILALREGEASSLRLRYAFLGVTINIWRSFTRPVLCWVRGKVEGNIDRKSRGRGVGGSRSSSAGAGHRRLSEQGHLQQEDVVDGSSTFSLARRLLLDSVLANTASNSQAAVLRRRAVYQLSSQGNSAPFLALIGVSLASGSGIVTKEHEAQQLCTEIRRAASRTRLLGEQEQEQEQEGSKSWSICDFELGSAIATGTCAVVYSGRVKGQQEQENNFPLAIKMMFNYHAESNASAILRAMHRETVPARALALGDLDSLVRELEDETVRLAPHPNIVHMPAVFADQVPDLPGAVDLYGTALPRRIHPQGLGRNMSLFMVMRRYTCSLASYLTDHPPSPRTSLVLLAQLLEGVAHLSTQGVAHR